MKKIFFLIILAAGLTAVSCKKKLEDMNIDNKSATKVESATLFSNAQKNLIDQVVTPSVNFNVLRLFSQYWAATTYPDETNYNIRTRAIPDNEFRVMYRDVLNDLKEAKSIVKDESAVISNAIQKKNKSAIAEILMVYAFHRLVDIFGNIPYEESLDINDVLPKYDEAQTIYSKLFDRLDAAIADLNPAEGSYGSADIIYGGNVAKWKKFANSLKLKMAITVADVPALNPGGRITSAVNNGVFTSEADNASFSYLSSSPNTNPIWVNLVASNRSDWVAANTIVDKMNQLIDPRRDDYFDGNLKDGVGNPIYKGGIYGGSNAYSNYTHITPTIQLPEHKGILLDYTEVQFYLAEAAARNLITGNAESYYNEAITSSILFWGGTAAEATAYLLTPNVAYATAPGTYKEKIGTQAWIAFYDRGDIAWTTWRRLDAPTLNQATGTTSKVPTRYTYPANEQTLNGANYTSAASAIGGDQMTTKLFWDKN